MLMAVTYGYVLQLQNWKCEL